MIIRSPAATGFDAQGSGAMPAGAGGISQVAAAGCWTNARPAKFSEALFGDSATTVCFVGRRSRTRSLAASWRSAGNRPRMSYKAERAGRSLSSPRTYSYVLIRVSFLVADADHPPHSTPGGSGKAAKTIFH